MLKKKMIFIIIVTFAVLLIGFAALMIFMYGCNTNRVAPMNEMKEHKGIYVDGTSLKMADGRQIVLRGINHSHCWFKAYDETAFDAIEATGANCIRIVLADGEQWEADTKDEVRNLIQMAKDRNMIAIVEVHDGTGSDSLESLQAITEFWIAVADVLKGTENYCILNIANEWVESWDSDIWAKG